MLQSRKNPTTGFLESVSHNRRTFDSNKKLTVIAMVKEFAAQGKFPRLSILAKAADVGIQTIRDHLQQDPVFKEAYEDAMSIVEENLVDNLIKQGANANGITANIFLLKSRWPERWGDRTTIVNVDLGSLKEAIDRSKGIIDAEIVSEPDNKRLIVGEHPGSPDNTMDKSA